MAISNNTSASGAVRTYRLAGWGSALLLLVAPLVAMQFTDSVSWGPGDFLLAALLLGGTGLIIELGWRVLPRSGPRALLALVVLAGLALVVAELSVGLFH